MSFICLFLHLPVRLWLSVMWCIINRNHYVKLPVAGARDAKREDDELLSADEYGKSHRSINYFLKLYTILSGNLNQ
jgi:hypothetical protein